jgi:hypothetical protein
VLPLRALPVAFVGAHLLVQAAAPAPLPEVGPFFRAVVAAIREDPRLQEQFTYVEERREVKVSRLGKVTVGPLRRFEVYPTAEPGGTYKRLIAEDGRSLTDEELARRDAEHREDLEKEAALQRRESPSERAEREREAREAREEREALLEDGLAVYEATLVARETMEGEPVIKVRLSPRPDARTTTREGSWMKHFTGHAWFSERNHQVTRVDMSAFEDVSIGWGIIGRIHQGTRIAMSRQRIGSNWLPARFELTASGRTLLFRSFAIEMVTTYSDYKRIDPTAPPLGR